MDQNPQVQHQKQKIPLASRKPAKLSEIVGNPSAAEAIRQWAESWASGKEPSPLIIHGPAGTGKTALAHAVASEFGWELFEYNASDFRNEENVEKRLSNAAISNTLSGGRRLILVDDVDALSGSGDRGGASAIARVLSSAKQPIMLTAHDLYDKKLQPFRSICTPIPLRRVSTPTTTHFLKKIAQEQEMPISQESIEKIAITSSGDVRAALNDLQGGNTIAFRDSEKGIFETIRAILQARDYKSARTAAFETEAEHDLLKLWVAHNLPYEYDRPFDLAEGYGALSRADVFDGRIKRTQYWGYLRYSNDLLSAGVALAKETNYRKFSKYSFPDYLREMGASKSGRLARKSVLRKIALLCHCSIGQAADYLPLIRASISIDEGTITEFGLDEDERAFISDTKAKSKKPKSSETGTQAKRQKKSGRARAHQ